MNVPAAPHMAATAVEPKAVLLIMARDHPASLREMVTNCLHEGLQTIVIDNDGGSGHFTTLTGLDVICHRLTCRSSRAAAIRTGAALAQERGFTAAIILAAGCSRAVSDARPLLRAARHCWPAIVVGEAPPDSADMKRARHFGQAINDFFLRLESGQNLPGTRSACRLYPLDFLTKNLVSESETFETEILVRAAWAGLPVIATPVDARPVPHRDRITRQLHLCALHARLLTLSLMPWRARSQPSTREIESAATSPLLHPMQFFRRLCVEHSSPVELAAAAWVGIFIGALPIIPFGIAAIVYVCHRLRLNKLAAAGASNVCVAPFVPFLCIQAGHFLRYGAWWTTFTRHALVNEIHLRLWEWLLGALIVGPVLATLGGSLTYALIVRLRGGQR